MQSISFNMPRPANVGALAGANPKDPRKGTWLNANARIINGSFTDGNLTGGSSHYVVGVIYARDSVTPSISDKNEKTIAIADDAAKGLMAFKSNREKNEDGYVERATVTMATQQPNPDTAVMGRDRTLVGNLRRRCHRGRRSGSYRPAVTGKGSRPVHAVHR